MFQRLRFLFALGLILTGSLASAGEWKTVETGFHYLRSSIETVEGPVPIHLFQLDPKRFRFQLLSAKEMNQSSAYMSDYFKHFKPIMAFNAGFFSPRYAPLGLRVDSGRIMNPAKEISWWSVLVAKPDGMAVLRTSDFRLGSSIDMALQAGPRLVINGTIPSLKPGKANRTAVGIQHDGDIIVAVVPAPVSTTQLAEKLARSESNDGAGCVDAINLDGGSSTQLMTKSGKFQLKIDGLASVVDAIGVVRR